MAPKELRGLSTSSSLLLFFFRKHFPMEMFWKFPKNWLLPLQGGREREKRLLVTQLMWKPLSFLFATCFVWAWIDPETTLFSPSSQVVFLYHMVQTQTKLDKTISNGGGVSCRVWARYATLLLRAARTAMHQSLSSGRTGKRLKVNPELMSQPWTSMAFLCRIDCPIRRTDRLIGKASWVCLLGSGPFPPSVLQLPQRYKTLLLLTRLRRFSPFCTILVQATIVIQE